MRRAVTMERALQCGELARDRKTFHRGDAASGNLAGGNQAGADLRTVEQHRAGAAIAGVAADLGAGGAELVAQHIGEASRRLDLHGDGSAVETEIDALARVPHGATSPSRLRATRASAASLR